jgi:hypothetical protein
MSGHVVYTEDIKCAYKILLEESKGMNQFTNLGVDGNVFEIGVMVLIGPGQGPAFL